MSVISDCQQLGSNQHTCLFLAFCSLLSPSSSSSIGRLSSAASCRRNSHRHCTGSTSKDPSLDWTKSANHGMDWEEACEGLKMHYSYRTHTEDKMCHFFLLIDSQAQFMILANVFAADKSLPIPNRFSPVEVQLWWKSTGSNSKRVLYSTKLIAETKYVLVETQSLFSR